LRIVNDSIKAIEYLTLKQKMALTSRVIIREISVWCFNYIRDV